MTKENIEKEGIKAQETDAKSEVVDIEKKEEKSESATEAKAESTAEEAVAAKKKKKKIRRQILKGQAHIQCTYNNTLVTFSDMSGKVLSWSSAGSLGFKGAKKATPYAATQIVNAASEKVSKYGLREIDVFVKGVGSGREASIRALVNNDFDIQIIKDITPVPHNGCRPKKPRRV
ncbi:MAG: 30S ribosomal protein S11 [Parcubacteria group bacterium]|jgi:small subunit ribosomal protein S11